MPASLFADFNWALLGAMLSIGLLAGFVGISGGALAIAVLTAFFKVPIHVAVGTSLAAMIFTSITGTISHLREGNVDRSIGVAIGLAGVVGAYLGGSLAAGVPGQVLKPAAGFSLLISAFLIYLRTRAGEGASGGRALPLASSPGSRLRAAFAGGIGLVGGGIAGLFGLGMAPYLQLGMIALLGTTLRIAVGTTMFVFVLIGLGGSLRFFQGGYVDLYLLVNIVIGTTVGAYVGAKFTRRVSRGALRLAVSSWPLVAAAMLILL